MNTSSCTVGSTAAQRPVIADPSLKTSCNVTTPKSTTDASFYQAATFKSDEFDDDFEPMPSCKLI